MTLEEKTLVREFAEDLKKEFGKSSLNAKEVAEHLDICPEFARKLISDGILPGYKIGKTFIVPVDSLALWKVRGARVQT